MKYCSRMRGSGSGRFFPSAFVLLFAFFLAVPVHAEEITEANWGFHPAILEVRNLYAEVETGVRIGRFRAETREFSDAAPGEDQLRVLYLDRQGSAGKYVRRGSNEGMLTVQSFYYDRAQRLRFIFISELLAVGSAAEAFEHRIYFDGDGNRIWESIRNARARARRLTAGGTALPVWPRDSLVFNPIAVFGANP